MDASVVAAATARQKEEVMVKRLTLEQATKAGHHCPMCGLVSFDPKPGIYTCVTCASEGYDCCVAGNGAECNDCANERSRRHA